jgi:hypothetical protein
MDETRRFRVLIPVFWFLSLVLGAAMLNPDKTQSHVDSVVTAVATIATPVKHGKHLPADTLDGCHGGPAKPNDRHITTDNRIDAKSLFAVLGALAGGGFLLVASGYVVGSITVTCGLTVTFIVRRMRESQVDTERRKLKSQVGYKRGDERFVLANNFHWECCVSPGERKRLVAILDLDRNGCDQAVFAAEHICVAYHHGILKKELQEHLTRRWDFFSIGANCVVAFGLALITVYILGLFPTSSAADCVMWCGIALPILVAMIVNGLAAWRFVRKIRRLCLCSYPLSGRATTRRDVIVVPRITRGRRRVGTTI